MPWFARFALGNATFQILFHPRSKLSEHHVPCAGKPTWARKRLAALLRDHKGISIAVINARFRVTMLSLSIKLHQCYRTS
jgi:hypothetical protein